MSLVVISPLATNDIEKIRKPQTRLKRTQSAPKRRGQLYVQVSEVYFYIYSLL